MKAEQAIEQDKRQLVSDSAGQGDAVLAQSDKAVTDIVEQARRDAARREQDDRNTWSRDNPDLICPAQLAIAVYENNYGQAVIRQERAWDEEEDTYVIISKHYLQDVIDRLQRILRGDEARS
jgi:hypothetical protein